MISAHELRIGNWVKNPLNNHTFQVLSIEKDAVGYEEVNGMYEDYLYYALDVLEPIHLTLEILEAAGFISKSEESSVLMAKLHSLYAELIDGNWHFAFPHDTLIEVKSLHQLQNLYFALTGEELEISLTAV